ncbi:hypothetical protein ACN1C3_04950 [Pseudomonas sp. H11T01]
MKVMFDFRRVLAALEAKRMKVGKPQNSKKPRPLPALDQTL